MHSPIFLADPAASTRFATALADQLMVGDVVLLDGDIGAGKSHISRAIIRQLTHPDEDVPSPTFTLVQTYDTPNFEIWHCDLYRLSNVEEVEDLGLFDAFDTAVCLVEWPDRLGDEAPVTALRLSLTTPKDGEGRMVSLASETPKWAAWWAQVDV